MKYIFVTKFTTNEKKPRNCMTRTALCERMKKCLSFDILIGMYILFPSLTL